MLWQTFWESFEASVHANPSLSNIQKFTYLKAQLHDAAQRCISGLSLTHANYDQAVILLKKRFGQESKIIDAHMQKLVDIPSPMMSLNSLSIFYDRIETSIRGLESLGQSHETYGALLTPIIFRKLPSEMRKNLTRDHGNSWNINSLREAIEKEIHVQEAGQLSYDDDTTPTAAFVTRATHRYNSQPHTKRPYNGPSKNTTKSCTYCDLSHPSTECTKVQEIDARYEIVKKKKLCFNCLGSHKASECRSRHTCRVCGKKHHTSLCAKGKESNEQTKPVTVNTVNASKEETVTISTLLNSSTSGTSQEVLLKTAITPIWYANQSAIANILLDEGSQKSFISEELANQLQVKPTGITTINLATFGDTNRNIKHMDKAMVNLETENGEVLPIEVLIVPRIAAPFNNIANYAAAKLPYLRGLKLAHPITKDRQFDINILIGADHYWQIVQDEIIRGQGPTAVKSKLGYLLSGPLMSQYKTTPTTMMLNVLVDHKQVEQNIERFWDLESMGISQPDNQKDTTSFYEMYEDSAITLKDNKYCAKLPWIDDCPELPINKNIVLRRTENVINRLNREPKMLKIYGDIIAEQEERGFIERVPDDEIPPERVHYIPHHPVKKDSLTTPIRIVYDCSCKESPTSASLNDCLMSVPPRTNDLTGILTRFRLHKYAVSTDIEKAFLQIQLHEDDRDVTRFFWLSDPEDASSPLITYRFKAILFGTTCSPFILNATIMKHLKYNACETTDKFKRDLYVDNVLSSFEDETQLMKFYKESRSILANGGFNLRSWCSNNSLLRTTAESENCMDKDELVKILG